MIPAVPRRLAGRRRGALSFLAAIVALLAMALPAVAADEPAPGLTIEARALMAGNVRPGSWAAVSVVVANEGPSLTGELRIRTPQQGRSVYGQPVDLPSGSRQSYTLYGQPPLFGTLLHVDLVSGGRTIHTVDVPVRSHDVYMPIVAVVAERPEGLLDGIRDGLRTGGGPRVPDERQPAVITVRVDDLPPRVEAWSAVDRLVWQDVDPRRLSADQAEALRLWLTAGGQLAVVAGTGGLTTMSGFAEDLLPFRPQTTIDVSAADLRAMLGELPPGIEGAPAVGGALIAGTPWGRSGAHVIAAHANVGEGRVTAVGVNASEPWLADSAAGRALWRKLLAAGVGADVNGLRLTDDSMLVGALNNLPAIDLPPIEQLFLLLFAYIALIGPVNYLVLRRLDRREWAWVTMPALVGIFAVSSYGMGASLKGSDVIVNELAIIRAAEGSERGLGHVYVGIFSPSRRTFDIRVGEGALLSNTISESQYGQTERPLDVVLGERSRLRNFEVGFGVLRSFRAQAATSTPLVESELRLSRGILRGTVSNRSEQPLENVALVYGGAVAVLGSLDAGASVELALDTAEPAWGYELSERIFGASLPRDPSEARKAYTRRAMLDQLTGYGSNLATGTGDPLLLAWRSGAVLDVEVGGEAPNRTGESLIVVPLDVSLDQHAIFNNQLLARTLVESTGDAYLEGGSLSLGRGTMTMELRPADLDGEFSVTSLQLALASGDVRSLDGPATELSPLADADQPDQDDPLGDPDGVAQPGPMLEVPRLQLFDHASGRWYEFPSMSQGRNYAIADAQRYVDGSGRVVVRLVNRTDEYHYFSLLARLEGNTR